MTLEVLLVRHAETSWNRMHRFQGHRDIDLSLRGRAWARARRLPAGFEMHRRYTSPLARTRHTAELLDPGPWRPDPRLMEMNWGAWTGRGWTSLEAELGPRLDEMRALGLDFRPPEGESPRELQMRAHDWLRTCAAPAPGVVALTHKGTMRALLGMAFDWDLAGRMPVKIDWSAGQLFQFDPRCDRITLARANIPLDLRPEREDCDEC